MIKIIFLYEYLDSLDPHFYLKKEYSIIVIRKMIIHKVIIFSLNAEMDRPEKEKNSVIGEKMI
jgi:hypothetical protein